MGIRDVVIGTQQLRLVLWGLRIVMCKGGMELLRNTKWSISWNWKVVKSKRRLIHTVCFTSSFTCLDMECVFWLESDWTPKMWQGHSGAGTPWWRGRIHLRNAPWPPLPSFRPVPCFTSRFVHNVVQFGVYLFPFGLPHFVLDFTVSLVGGRHWRIHFIALYYFN